MNMHESHNLPQRPVFTPIEWSNLKLEQDRNKQEITRRVQLQQQQEMAVAHQRLVSRLSFFRRSETDFIL